VQAEAHAAQRQTVQLNRRIQDWDAKLKEEQPNNIAALQENKRVRTCRPPHWQRERTLLTVLVCRRSQETEQERENMLAQYKAGLAKFEESSASQSAAQAVEEKQAIEEELKQHERILRKLRVGRIMPETIVTLVCTDGFGNCTGTYRQGDYG
jgi:hypothetical protein